MNTLASLLRETFPRTLGRGAEAVADALQVRCPRCGEGFDEGTDPDGCRDPHCPMHARAAAE